MRNKPVKHATMLALAGLCGVLFVQTSSRADLVLPGYDLFTTVSNNTWVILGPNQYYFGGVPLGTYNFGGSNGVQNVGNTDTIMQRIGSSGNGQTIPLQLDALQLVSTTPMFGPGVYGYITLDPNYTSGGTITISNDFTFQTSFDVYYDLHIGSLDGTIYTSGEATDMTETGTWQHDPPPGALLIQGVNYLLNGVNTSNDFWVPDGICSNPSDSHEVVPTPEPSGLALLCLGVLCLAIKTRRGRKQATRSPLI
jgi:hypothetical protein